MYQATPHVDPQSLLPDIFAYRLGDDEAGNRLATILQRVVILEVSRTLGDHHPDRKDVCQDSIIAGLGYLRSDQEFRGNLVALVVAIARNRCRDLLRKNTTRRETNIEPLSPFLKDPGRSFVEDLDDRRMFDLLQQCLDRISPACRQLIKALYIDGKSTEEFKNMIGLTTVQGVYYRRSVCLAKMRKLLQNQFQNRSGVDEPHRGDDNFGKEDQIGD